MEIYFPQVNFNIIHIETFLNKKRYHFNLDNNEIIEERELPAITFTIKNEISNFYLEGDSKLTSNFKDDSQLNNIKESLTKNTEATKQIMSSSQHIPQNQSNSINNKSKNTNIINNINNLNNIENQNKLEINNIESSDEMKRKYITRKIESPKNNIKKYEKLLLKECRFCKYQNKSLDKIIPIFDFLDMMEYIDYFFLVEEPILTYFEENRKKFKNKYYLIKDKLDKKYVLHNPLNICRYCFNNKINEKEGLKKLFSLFTYIGNNEKHVCNKYLNKIGVNNNIKTSNMSNHDFSDNIEYSYKESLDSNKAVDCIAEIEKKSTANIHTSNYHTEMVNNNQKDNKNNDYGKIDLSIKNQQYDKDEEKNNMLNIKDISSNDKSISKHGTTDFSNHNDNNCTNCHNDNYLFSLKQVIHRLTSIVKTDDLYYSNNNKSLSYEENTNIKKSSKDSSSEYLILVDIEPKIKNIKTVNSNHPETPTTPELTTLDKIKSKLNQIERLFDIKIKENINYSSNDSNLIELISVINDLFSILNDNITLVEKISLEQKNYISSLMKNILFKMDLLKENIKNKHKNCSVVTFENLIYYKNDLLIERKLNVLLLTIFDFLSNKRNDIDIKL